MRFCACHRTTSEIWSFVSAWTVEDTSSLLKAHSKCSTSLVAFTLLVGLHMAVVDCSAFLAPNVNDKVSPLKVKKQGVMLQVLLRGEFNLKMRPLP